MKETPIHPMVDPGNVQLEQACPSTIANTYSVQKKGLALKHRGERTRQNEGSGGGVHKDQSHAGRGKKFGKL